MIKFDLSELPIAQHQYRMAGIGLLVAGVLILMIGLFFALTAESRQIKKDHLQTDADECVSRISQLGLKATSDGAEIRVAESNMSKGVQLLAQSSQAANLCPEWSLEQYCLGSGCKPAGLTMTLRHNEIKK